MKFFAATVVLATSAMVALAADSDSAEIEQCLAQAKCQADPTSCYSECLDLSSEQLASFASCTKGCTLPTDFKDTTAVTAYNDCATDCLDKFLPSSLTASATSSGATASKTSSAKASSSNSNDDGESDDSSESTSSASSVGFSAGLVVAALALTRY
ncbi:hypothetical protein BJ085DRAFT_36553 [Dimargaris cristalligena]|uniref:Extracellular membrane protein CFEM domain-containing protein n=1 Tax=Dimargaris cristalligena TaxID=215637 RepID=A0A4P9ZVG0_9FUNG|nr:hypothetical protein BJ085DRAFT_36553 [Dimargaris cristalligena]|eukprot:RKP37575.1 hypothetical protein BJ085DRAFT_36553 [Dimargaris cristalligena]